MVRLGWVLTFTWVILGLSGCVAQRRAEAPVLPEASFESTAFRAGSGLRVVVERAPDKGVSGVVLLVRSGSAEEPEGQAGLAHLVEHLVFQARHGENASVWHQLGALGGGAFNGMTSWDYTAYYAFVPAQQQGELLDVMAKVLKEPLAGISNEAFRHELAIVDTERRQRTENGTPGEALGYLAAATFPGQHPYARPVVGTPLTLSGLSLEDARDYARRNYRADNAILVSLAPGDLTKQRQLVESRFLQKFSGSGGRPAPDTPGPPPPAPRGSSKLERHAALVASKTLWVGWSVPAEAAPAGDIAALLESMLEGAFWQNLDQRDRDIASVRAGYLPGRSAGLFYIEAALTKGDDPEGALESLLGRVGPGLAERINSPTVLEIYKRHVATESTYATEDLVARAFDLALSAHMAEQPEYLRQRPQRMLGLEEDGVRAYMDQYLKPERARAVFIEPLKGADSSVPLGERNATLERGGSLDQSFGTFAKAQRSWMKSVGVANAKTVVLENGLTVVVLRSPGSPFHTAFLGFHGGALEGNMRAAAAAVSWARRHNSYSPSVKGRAYRGSVEKDSMWSMLRATGYDIQGTLDALHEEVTDYRIEWPPQQFQVISENLEQEERSPKERWFRQRRAALFGTHPYGADITVAAMRQVTATDIVELLEQLRQPDNGLLVLVGDFDEQRALAAAQRTFGSWHRGGSGNQLLPAAPPLSQLPRGTRGMLRVAWPGASLATLGLDCVLPPATQPKDEAALDLFQIILERGLFNELRGGAANAYAVDVDLSRLRGGTRVLQVSTGVTHGHLQQGFQALARLLHDSPDSLVPVAAWEGARSQLAREYNLSLVTTAAVAKKLFDASQSGWALTALDRYPDDVLATTREDVLGIVEHCRANGFLSLLSDPAQTPTLLE